MAVGSVRVDPAAPRPGLRFREMLDHERFLVLDVSDDAPAVLAPMVAGTLPLVGLNEHGAAFGTMSLSALDEKVGVPRALVARPTASKPRRLGNWIARASGVVVAAAVAGSLAVSEGAQAPPAWAIGRPRSMR